MIHTVLHKFTFRAIAAFLALTIPAKSILADNPPAQDDAIPYVLTISGGVSLGAYEAGLNWALTNYLKFSSDEINTNHSQVLPPQLITVTGASAGSINGLLTAITSCVDFTKVGQNSQYHGTVSNNLFKEIWVDVGLDGLLPKDPKHYLDNDGLLSRIPFSKPLDKIRKIMSEKIFLPECSLPLGITVTDEAPTTIQIAGITVNNQRHFIPLLLKTDRDGNASFYAYPVDQSNPNYGNVIYLPPASNPVAGHETIHYKIDINQVIKAVLASSAFPIAFGRVKLDYCSPPAIDGSLKPASPNVAHHCPKQYSAQSAIFIDGGVFDNIPLGSAKALAEERLRNSARRISYIFMDPDNRRSGAKEKKPSATLAASGSGNEQPAFVNYNLLDQMKFIGGAVLTARNYELYKVLTSGDWTNQSFYYVDILNKLIDADLFQKQFSEDIPASFDCTGFFKTFSVSEKPHIDGKWLSRTKYCINKESNALDYRYQYLPASPEALQAQRSQLVDHLAAIALLIKGKKLSRQVEQIKNDNLGDRRILLSSRFFPLTGAYLGAFGAFFDRPFRKFDYYVGIYDGIHDIASHACQFRQTITDTAGFCQEGMVAKNLYDTLHIDVDPNARFVFASIGLLEHPDYSRQDSAWGWLADIDIRAPDKHLQLIFNALNNGYDKDGLLTAPEFDEFIRKLKNSGYSTGNSSEYFRYIIDKDKDWWVLPSIRISDRLYKLEENTEKESNKKSILKRPLAVVSTVAHLIDERGKVITFEQPGSAKPGTLLGLLPYEIGIRANHDHTPYLAWEPTLDILGKEMLRFKITPLQAESRQEQSEKFYQVSVMHNFIMHDLFNFGAALDINGAWQPRDTYDRVTSGLSVNMEFKKKLRITFGFYDFYDHFTDYNFYLNVGFTDIASYFQ